LKKWEEPKPKEWAGVNKYSMLMAEDDAAGPGDDAADAAD